MGKPDELRLFVFLAPGAWFISSFKNHGHLIFSQGHATGSAAVESPLIEVAWANRSKAIGISISRKSTFN